MPNIAVDALDTKKYIIIKGARVHNLKNVSVGIPRNNFVVITGLSGSGKSSLAFDTLFAEGQRRYVESLSSYARQFLGKIDKPDVDYIKGISPAIAIEQKVITRSSRSTVGTTTEIYDYLKLLYARIGKTYSPLSGKEIKRDTQEDVVNYILSFPDNTRAALYAPLHVPPARSLKDQLKILVQQGLTRVKIKDKLLQIEDLLKNKKLPEDNLRLLIDRFP
jgi:excinuclease ABC subunit A